MMLGKTLSKPLLATCMLAVAATLAGCGGGGSGGGGGSAASLPTGVVSGFSGKLSDVSRSFKVAPRYAHVQFDHVQQPPSSSGPSGPGGLVLSVDPAAGTVGATLAPVDFRIDFDDDSRAFASDYQIPDIATRYRARMLIPGAASGYDYTSYGIWSQTVTSCILFTCGSRFYADSFSFGSPTGSMPSSGKATFNGTMDGYYVPATQQAYDLSGEATLVADFGNKTVTGSFHHITPSAIMGPALAGFGSISVNARISGSTLAGSVSGPGGSGTLAGDFFGPDATEMGGVFHTPATIGAFAAKR